MELTTSMLYWILKLDTIIVLCIVICSISGLIAIVAALKEYLFLDGDCSKCIKYSLNVFIISIMLCVFTPSTKQIAMLVVIPKIVNNEQVQEIPQKLLDITSNYLEELIDRKNDD